jgi:hypothetical protein
MAPAIRPMTSKMTMNANMAGSYPANGHLCGAQVLHAMDGLAGRMRARVPGVLRLARLG